MAIDSATFKVRFKVFDQVEDAITDQKLADAQAFLDEGAFAETDMYERAVFYYAAALLTDDPYGTPMGLTTDVNAQEVNRYRQIFKEQILPLIRRRGQITGGGLP
jgi:hypothetical protein